MVASVRDGLLLVAFVLLMSSGPIAAEPAGRMPTVGYVGLPHEPTEPRWRDGFARGLRELGYVPGQNIALDVRTYTTREQMDRVLGELGRERVDVIFVGQPLLALAAKRLTRDIPIVCGSCGDPTENGLAASLARPGGNVTGLASLSAELIGKRAELLKELLPRASRLAVFVFPANPGTRATVRALEAVGPKLGLELSRFEIRGPADFDGAFGAAARAGASGVLVQDDPLLRSAGAHVADLALKHRLPVSAGVFELAESGALMAYGPDRVELYRRAAGFVDKILKGAKPGDLPFEQAAKFGFVVNLRTAKALGLAVPPSFLSRADRIIE
jgi:putative tryptophan/tyrosine transport system substrate-binding protein